MPERDELIDRIESAEQRLLMRYLRDQAKELLRLNMTVPQFQVLLVLWIGGPMPAHSLADLLHVGPNAVTGIVDRLVSRDLVRRRDSAQDRRVRLVELSDGGRQLIENLTTAARALRRQLLEQLPIDALHRFEQAMTDAAGMPAHDHSNDVAIP